MKFDFHRGGSKITLFLRDKGTQPANLYHNIKISPGNEINS